MMIRTGEKEREEKEKEKGKRRRRRIKQNMVTEVIHK